MRKIYVLDTSVLINDPYAYKHFVHSDVIIPIAVLNELDNLKKQSGEAGKHARVAIKALDEIGNKGDISTGVMLDNDIQLKIDANYYDASNQIFSGFGDPKYGDTQILICAYMTWLEHPFKDVSLVSNDINLRVKAKSRNIEAIAYEENNASLSDLYSGIRDIIDENAGIELQRKGHIDPYAFGLTDLNPNECILFKNSSGDGIAMGRKVSEDKIKLIKKVTPWGINSRNKEQSFALDLMMDKNINLVTFIGKAGTGKSLIVLAAALELVCNRKEYDKFIIYRPIQPVSNDIGYIPGPQPIDAKIATPNGWTTMGEIKPGDYVISRKGLPSKVLEIFPKGKKEVFKITTSDGTSTEACGDHPWAVKTLYDREIDSDYRILTTNQMKDKLNPNRTSNYQLPRNMPVQFNKKELPIPPYSFGANLVNNSLADNNSILDIYKYSSIEDRIELLRGLIDTHGVINNEEYLFSTTSNKLAKDIAELVMSLGGKATLNVRDKIENSLIESKIVFYDLTINMSNNKTKIPLFIQSIESVGEKEVKCILIEDDEHLYLTDNFIVTHNTIQEKLAPWFQAIMDNLETLLSVKNGDNWKRSLEMFQKKGLIEMEAITYIRGRSIPNAIILIDEAQNLSKEDVKTILTRAGENTKIILTGDIEQIDNSALDATNNGLTHVIEKFKNYELSGHITFVQGERSKLASKAAEIL